MHDEPKLSEVLEAVKDGFGLMDEKFAKVDERLDAIDRRFDGVDRRFDGLEKRMDRQEGKMNALVNVLQEKHVITEEEKKSVHA